MVKLIIFLCALLPMSILADNASMASLDGYIGEMPLSFYQKERTKSLAHSLNRIQTENWWSSDVVFNNISENLNKSLSCYIHATKDEKDNQALIDDLEFLVADNNEKKKMYQHFLIKDNQITHEMTPEPECYN